MDLSAFRFELPEGLIAQFPLAERGGSRLLHLDTGGAIHHRRFPDLATLLRPGDLLVLNDTRVVPARLVGAKSTGGRVELLLERLLGEREALVQLGASKTPHNGAQLHFGPPQAPLQVTVMRREAGFFRVTTSEPLLAYLERYGKVPLPPYVRREPDARDLERYQTTYARVPGAVAAPTAGLHFSEALLDQLQAGGVRVGFVTLHVGAGTFQPLRPEQLAAGRLHREWLQVSDTLCDSIDRTRAAGARVVAVGTTVLRALESAVRLGRVSPFEGETELFIRPPYRCRAVQALVTNFHLPASSLLMLVCAFGGTQPVMAAYRQAVADRYRFFSYGDAMFIEQPVGPDEV